MLFPNKEFDTLPRWKYVVDNAPIPPAIPGHPLKSETIGKLKQINEGVHSLFEYKNADPNLAQWLIPMQMEAQGGGNCADFAVYLMYDLYKRGLAKGDMAIGVGRIKAGPHAGEMHAVLLVYRVGHFYCLSCPGSFPEYQEGSGLGDFGMDFIYLVSHEGWQDVEGKI